MPTLTKSQTHDADSSVAALHAAIDQIEFLQAREKSLANTKALLSALSKLENIAGHLRAKAGLVINDLHEKGESPSLTSVLKGNGETSITTAEHKALHTQALEHVPELAEVEAVACDYLEITARKFRKLDDKVRDQISSDWIITAIKKNPPDKYRKLLSQKIERIDTDIRRKEDLQAWRNSEGSAWLNKRTGEGYIHTRFAPQEWEQARKAIEAEMRRMAATSETELNLNAELFAAAHLNLLLAGSAPNGHGSFGNKQYQPKASIEIIVDEQTAIRRRLHPQSVLQTSSGINMSVESLERHICDATVQKVVHGSANIPVNVGRKHRTATVAQKGAIRSMYSACAWADCNEILDWCEIHHIKYWRNGGATDLDNLIPLCNNHHHQAHEGGWQLKLNQDRSLKLVQPNGVVWKTTKPPNRKPEPEGYSGLDLDLDVGSRSGDTLPWPEPKPPPDWEPPF